MLSILTAVLGFAAGPVKQWMEQRSERSEAKHKRLLTEIEAGHQWETTMAENSGSSWKDEYLTLVTTSPFILMFVAVLTNSYELMDRIRSAFIIMARDIPEEFWYLLGVVYAASFAIKGVPTVLAAMKGKQ